MRLYLFVFPGETERDCAYLVTGQPDCLFVSSQVGSSSRLTTETMTRDEAATFLTSMTRGDNVTRTRRENLVTLTYVPGRRLAL